LTANVRKRRPNDTSAETWCMKESQQATYLASNLQPTQ
jgi:hypothetical protein